MASTGETLPGEDTPPAAPPERAGLGAGTGVGLGAGLGAGLRAGRLGRAGTRVLVAIGESLRSPATMLPLVLLAAFVARTVWLVEPVGGLIFDEAYYVNAARVLIGTTPSAGANYADSMLGLDPNTEHPPLGKLLIAASMLVFGDNGIGWRIPSLIAGVIALFATYAIVRASGESARLGILVVAILAFDNLTLVHGRIGTLDMLVLAPMLVGAWLAIRERWVLAAIAMALAVLVKITALYAIGAVLLFYLFQHAGRWWRERRIPLADLRPPLAFSLVFVTVGLAGLGLLDIRFTSFDSPIDHLRRIVEYGARLAAPVTTGAFCPEANSQPWQWLFNECQIVYLRVDVSVREGGELVSSIPRVDFRGALNPVLMGLIPLSTAWLGWYAWRSSAPLARWAVAWGAANYLPFVLLALVTDRIMYIYYFLPVVPAVAIAIALLLARSGLPRAVLYAFVVAYALGFAAYFPFRQVP